MCTLPTPIQGLMLYEKSGVSSSPKGQVSFEMLAYHYSSISKVDVKTGTFQTIKNNLHAEGRPQYAQDNAGNMHIVDGANPPMYYNGSTITAVSTWPPVYTATVASQYSNSSLLVGSNPTTTSTPIDCTFYANRMWYITDNDIATVFFSKASGNTGTASTDFQTNNGSPVPIDIAGPAKLPAQTTFTGILGTPNGILVYGQNSTGRILGQNAPIGVGDEFRYETINSTIGCLSPHLVGELSDNQHMVVANNGVFLITLSDNFQEVRPGQISYDIQPDLDSLGRYALSTGKLLIAPHTGIAILAVPRNITSLWRDRLWIYHYAVGQKAKPVTFPWMISEEFGGTPTQINDIVVDPTDNMIYFAIGDTVYKWEGLTFLNGKSRRREYQFPPNNFDWEAVNKYAMAYNISYKSSTGARARLDHSWSNGDGGSTEIVFPAQDVTEVGTAVLGTDPVFFRSAFADNTIRVPIAGGQIGKDLIVTYIHDSDTEDLTIYDIQVEWEVMGVGA